MNNDRHKKGTVMSLRVKCVCACVHVRVCVRVCVYCACVCELVNCGQLGLILTFGLLQRWCQRVALYRNEVKEATPLEP